MNKVKILLVDDEEDILEMIKYNLEKDDYDVQIANNGELAIDIAQSFKPHVILLDIMMPGMDGIEVCEALRSLPDLQNILIAFLTARSESFTHISALESGGDDFITKPIKPNVLRSRIKALLRRHLEYTSNKSASEESFGDLLINYDKFTVKVNDTELVLAKKEFELLKLLASAPGKVFKRNEIMHKVWGTTVIVGDRTIDVHIRKLREKIGSHFIKTLKGVGYKFEY